MGEAFLAGAQLVNPDAKLPTTAVGVWEDVAAAKEPALAQADAGVDFWIECGENPALGAIESAKERCGYTRLRRRYERERSQRQSPHTWVTKLSPAPRWRSSAPAELQWLPAMRFAALVALECTSATWPGKIYQSS